LRKTHLVALRGNQVELVTNELMAFAMPDGTIVAADNKSGLLTRWLAAHGYGWLFCCRAEHQRCLHLERRTSHRIPLLRRQQTNKRRCSGAL